MLNEFISDYKIPTIMQKDGIKKEIVEDMKAEF